MHKQAILALFVCSNILLTVLAVIKSCIIISDVLGVKVITLFSKFEYLADFKNLAKSSPSFVIYISQSSSLKSKLAPGGVVLLAVVISILDSSNLNSFISYAL